MCDISLTITKQNHLAFIIEGLRDESVSVRLLCARELGRVSPDFTEDVIPELIKSLDDVDYRVINTSLQSLGNYGKLAIDAMPKIQFIFLVDNEHWDRNIWNNNDISYLNQDNDILYDPEVVTRGLAAFAAIKISSIEHTFDNFHNLDEKGEIAVSLALSRYIMEKEEEFDRVDIMPEKITEYLVAKSINNTTNAKGIQELKKTTIWGLLFLHRKNPNNLQVKAKIIQALKEGFPGKENEETKSFVNHLLDQLEN